jgi:transketolase
MTVLFFGEFVHEEKSKFIMSKGHANLVHSTILEMMGTPNVRHTDHPEYGNPGIVCTSGSLGQGLGVACGMALANKLNNVGKRVYTIVGDGECYEGLTQEALNFITNIPITVLIDYNGYSCEKESLHLSYVKTHINGHNIEEIYNAIKETSEPHPRGHIICCHTTKGYGIPSIYHTELLHYITLNKDNIESITREMDFNLQIPKSE